MSKRSRGQHHARLWERINGDWVKLSLAKGQTIEHYEGGPTEEGFHHRWESWEYDDNIPCIRYRVVTQSRDCDGRYSSDSEHQCAVTTDQLFARENYDKEKGPNGEIIMLPEWKPGDSRWRDYSAEAAGY